MTPGWWSQQFPPDGSAASDGILRQLGAPALDPLVVLLRETAQNSWDARLDEKGTIGLEFEVAALAERSAALVRALLPGPVGDLERLPEALGPESTVLRVSDRMTTGLGGPLRSDMAAGDEPPNFVNFIRNVGEARDRWLGGGTYGFGKGALFRVSRPGVILVDTLCRTAAGPERRLIGAALGSAFVKDGRRHTGRHWWGVTATDGIVDPLVGHQAEVVAAELGLRGFSDGVTGTDVYVLDATLGDEEDGPGRTRGEAAEVLASAGLWYLWPKLLRGRPPGRIEFSVLVDGAPLSIPPPERAPRLVCFVDALKKIDNGDSVFRTRQTPPKMVGAFAAATGVWLEQPNSVVDAAAPFEGAAHHCARMRHVELVVDYFVGEALPDPALQYGAVFRASEDEAAEACFAAAEPPTHDAWNTQHLSGTEKGVVTAARTFVREQLAKVANPSGKPSGDAANVPLGAVSKALAAILPRAGGDAAGGDEGSDDGDEGDGGGRRAQVRAKGRPRLVIWRDEAMVAQSVVFQPVNRELSATVRADVAVDGGTERVAPEGAAVPEVIGWEDSDGRFEAGDTLTVQADEDRSWTVFVRPAPDTATIVRVSEKR